LSSAFGKDGVSNLSMGIGRFMSFSEYFSAITKVFARMAFIGKKHPSEGMS
jgi:hypothetical protein